MKASHYLTDMADSLEISKSGFFAHQRKAERPELNRTTPYRRRSKRSLWPAARLTAVRASCMRCAEADGVVGKIASPGSCAHAACTPDKSVDLDPKQLRATITAGGAKLVGQDPKAGPSRPGLAGRHHLYPDAGGLALPFRYPRPLLTTLCRLVCG
jgi:hypothetical protein